MKDINKLYQEVLRDYYKTDKYIIPTISWTQEYPYFRWGEYQSWNNDIKISRVLDTDKLSDMAIKSVIYHELIHQEHQDHDSKFNRKVETFPDYYQYQKEIDNYIDSLVDVPLLNPPNKFGENKERIIFCTLPDEQYYNWVQYYNKNLYVNPGRSKWYSSEFISDSDTFVIWLVLNDDLYYVVGWSDNCTLYQSVQKVRHAQYGGLNFDYHIKTKTEETFLIPFENVFCIIPKSYFPATFEKDGAIVASDISEFSLNDVLYEINTYSGEFEVMGLTDDAIYSTYPLLEENYEKIIKESLKNRGYRSLWMANLAVKRENNFETIFNQAKALKDNYVLDDACLLYEKTLEINQSSEEAIISLLKLHVILDKKPEAEKLLNIIEKRSINTKDKELSACIKSISK